MTFLPALPFLADSLVREESESDGKRRTHNWLLFSHRVDGLVESVCDEEDKVPGAREVFYSSKAAGFVTKDGRGRTRRSINAICGEFETTDVLKWFTTMIGTSAGDKDLRKP